MKLMEFDPHKLSQLIARTELAMFIRLQVLAASSNGQAEQEAIADACHGLYFLKRDLEESQGIN